MGIYFNFRQNCVDFARLRVPYLTDFSTALQMDGEKRDLGSYVAQAARLWRVRFMFCVTAEGPSS